MQLIERILLALDFGAASDAATSRALSLVKRFGGEIVPVHAVETLGGTDQAVEQMEPVVARLRAAGVSVRTPILHHGNPASVILHTANAMEVNLIVTGLQPRGVIAQRLAHRALMPLWAVQPAIDGAAPLRVLCPLDYSTASGQALRSAIHLVRNLGGCLHLLHVVEDPASEPAGDPPETVLDSYLQSFDLAGIEHTRALAHGRVHEAIVQAADQSAANLIALGAVGKGSVLDQFIGNNTDRLLRAAPCSVLAVKHQDLFKVAHDHAPLGQTADGEPAGSLATSVAEIADYIETHFGQGRNLLSQGFLEDAIIEFKLCIAKDHLFTEAYEAIATAYERLGRPRKAEHYQSLARDHRRILWQEKVQAEIRRQHSLFREGVSPQS